MFVTIANDTWNTHEIPRHCNCIINVDVIMWFYCTVIWNEVTAISLLRPFRTRQHMRAWFMDTTAAISCSWEITYWHDLIGQDDSGKVRLGNIVRPVIICHRSLVWSSFQTNVTWCLTCANNANFVQAKVLKSRLVQRLSIVVNKKILMVHRQIRILFHFYVKLISILLIRS